MVTWHTVVWIGWACRPPTGLHWVPTQIQPRQEDENALDVISRFSLDFAANLSNYRAAHLFSIPLRRCNFPAPLRLLNHHLVPLDNLAERLAGGGPIHDIHFPRQIGVGEVLPPARPVRNNPAVCPTRRTGRGRSEVWPSVWRGSRTPTPHIAARAFAGCL